MYHLRKFTLKACIFLLAFLPACSPRVGDTPKQVCFYDRCVKVEVVQTPQERTRGLQNRKALGKNEGMLFIFEKSQVQSFWMKDTFIPLDIIWMDRDKNIVFLIPNVLPCETEQCPVYTPDKDSFYVLEVNAGVSIELGLGVGDQAEFR